MNALIFGSNGQDGYYLSKFLLEKKINTIGVSRNNADVVGSVGDIKLVSDIIKIHKPTYIFHFAANSTTNHEAIWENHDAICTGAINILESVNKYSPSSKVFLSGSGLQFENKEVPLDEDSQFAATSPYTVSRNHSLFAARYFRSIGLKVFFGYFFNHESPRRPYRHISQKIIHYCKNINIQKEKLLIGNAKVKKEWTYAGDIVEAIWIFVNQDNVFECVIGSGLAHSIEEWLSICFSKINKNWRDHIQINPNFKPEYNLLVSNPALLRSLGWNQKVSLEELCELMFK